MADKNDDFIAKVSCKCFSRHEWPCVRKGFKNGTEIRLLADLSLTLTEKRIYIIFLEVPCILTTGNTDSRKFHDDWLPRFHKTKNMAS